VEAKHCACSLEAAHGHNLGLHVRRILRKSPNRPAAMLANGDVPAVRLQRLDYSVGGSGEDQPSAPLCVAGFGESGQRGASDAGGDRGRPQRRHCILHHRCGDLSSRLGHEPALLPCPS